MLTPVDGQHFRTVALLLLCSQFQVSLAMQQARTFSKINAC
jgi:hypothetical protein